MARRKSNSSKDISDVVLSRATKAPRTHFNPAYVAKAYKEIDMPTVEAAIDARMESRNDVKLEQYKGKAVIKSDAPVMVVLWGDMHYGSGDVDYERFHRDRKFILETPGVYMIGLSNVIDNAIPSQFPDGMLQNVINPEQQVLAMRHYFEELNAAGKVLGVVTSPCHEGWTWKKAGQDINRLIYDFPSRKFPVLETGGRLDVQVNDQSYYFGLYHQIQFHSALNFNNATQRMKQLHHPQADVIAAAHNHVAEIINNYYGRQDDKTKFVGVRAGCYKLDDAWAAGKGFSKGMPGGVSIELWHDRKEMAPKLDIVTAIQEHEALGLSYRARALKRR